MIPETYPIKKEIENFKIYRLGLGDFSKNIEPMGYPESIEVTVCKGEIRFFHQCDSLLTESERALFAIGSDRVVIDSGLGRADYRRVNDTASLVKGNPQRTLQYTLERKFE